MGPLLVPGRSKLVNTPGGLDLDVVLDSEERGQPLPLPLGEQVGSGALGPSSPVERIVLAPAVTVTVLLDAPPAPVQRVTGQAPDVEVKSPVVV